MKSHRVILLKVAALVVLAFLLFPPVLQSDEQVQTIQAEAVIKTELPEILINQFGLPSYEHSVTKSTTQEKYFDIELSSELQEYTKLMCEKYSVDLVEALSVMTVENSQYDEAATHTNKNGSKDVGLFQINTINHEWLNERLGLSNLYDPYQNIEAGVYILSMLGEKYEGHFKFMAYNYGIGGARKAVDNGQFSSAYSRKVMAQIEKFRSGGY